MDTKKIEQVFHHPSSSSGLAAKAKGLLDAGADETCLDRMIGGASGVAETTHTKEAPKTPIGSAHAADETRLVSTKTPSTFSIPDDEKLVAAVSPLTPQERQGLFSIRELALKATLEMNTLREELEVERKRTKAYASELGKLRVSATETATKAYSSVSSAASTAKDAEAIRTALVARATVAERDAFEATRRAGDLEKILKIERERNGGLLAALNAASEVAATANQALTKRAEDAEASCEELRLKILEAEHLIQEAETRAHDAEMCAEEAMQIAADATRNATDTARVAEKIQKKPSQKKKVPKSTRPTSAPKTSPRKPLMGNTFSAAFAPPSESKHRAMSPGRRCQACANRNWESCEACDGIFETCDVAEISVPTAAGATAAWTGLLRSPGPADRMISVSHGASTRRLEIERDEPGTTRIPQPTFSPKLGPTVTSRWQSAANFPQRTQTLPRARRSLQETVAIASKLNKSEVRATVAEQKATDFESLRDAIVESTRVSSETLLATSTRVADLEAQMAVTNAELELDRERRDERRAAVSPGAENRRRRRRERMEVSAKLDATEQKLQSMLLEDIDKMKRYADFWKDDVVEITETQLPISFFRKTQKSISRNALAASSTVSSMVSSGVRGTSSLVHSLSPVAVMKKEVVEKEVTEKQVDLLDVKNIARSTRMPVAQTPRSAPLPVTPLPGTKEKTEVGEGFTVDFS